MSSSPHNKSIRHKPSTPLPLPMRSPIKRYSYIAFDNGRYPLPHLPFLQKQSCHPISLWGLDPSSYPRRTYHLVLILQNSLQIHPVAFDHGVQMRVPRLRPRSQRLYFLVRWRRRGVIYQNTRCAAMKLLIS